MFDSNRLTVLCSRQLIHKPELFVSQIWQFIHQISIYPEYRGYQFSAALAGARLFRGILAEFSWWSSKTKGWGENPFFKLQSSIYNLENFSLRQLAFLNPYQPESTQISPYQPVSTHINLYQPVSTRINWNQPESTGIKPNQPKSTRFNPKQSESLRINPNQPELTRINQIQPDETCINPY